MATALYFWIELALVKVKLAEVTYLMEGKKETVDIMTDKIKMRLTPQQINQWNII